jgi:hypothetical protein
MERITFEVKDPADAQLLLAFARRIGSKVIAETRASAPQTEKSRSTIDRGCDISSFGDPSDWQRMMRTERSLPYRGE